MRSKHKKILVIISALLLFAGVTTAAVLYLFPYQPDQPPKADDTGSTQLGILEVANANNQFAFDLYKQLIKTEPSNLFFSPYSISTALAMTYAGAKGQTASEMKSVFHFPEDTILKPNSATIYNQLNAGAKDYELRTGNALWIQKDFQLLSDYTNTVEKYFGGKATNLDFVTDTENSRVTINTFIEKQTKNIIVDLIPKGTLDESARLVLTNAIYFKGTWQWEFDPSDTHDGDFTITPNNIVTVKMMNMQPDKTTFNYADIGDIQILELPYKGNKISMLVILPSSDLASIETTLTSEKLNEYKSQMQQTKLDSITMPKFEFDTKYFMKDTLSALGMPTAFSDKADFSGMTGANDLMIGFVIHQAFIKVDEVGTEAAAATAVGMELKSIPQRTVFRADHPFIFIIQDRETSNILFIGKVVDPNKVK